MNPIDMATSVCSPDETDHPMHAIASKEYPTREEWHAAAAWCMAAAAKCNGFAAYELRAADLYYCAAKCCERAANPTY